MVTWRGGKANSEHSQHSRGADGVQPLLIISSMQKKEQLRAAGCSIAQIRSQRHHSSQRRRKKRRLYCTRRQQTVAFISFFMDASPRGNKAKKGRRHLCPSKVISGLRTLKLGQRLAAFPLPLSVPCPVCQAADSPRRANFPLRAPGSA